MPESKREALELYNYAIKNKIGLLYLESLKKGRVLEDLGLKSDYEKEQERYYEQMITAARISRLLNLLNVDYAIFKSIMPFATILNDIDIIYFCPDDKMDLVTCALTKSGYTEVKVIHVGKVANNILQYQFHDMRKNVHKDPLKKDIYDLDIYREITVLDYIIYLDKKNLQKYITTRNLLGTKVSVLRPEAELVAIMAHSVVKEQIFTLLVYFATSYYFAKMNSEDIDMFIKIVKENNVIVPVRTCICLVAKLHEKVHGLYPEKLNKIIEALGYESLEVKNLIREKFKMPHHYNLLILTRTLLEIAKENRTRKSIAWQVKHMLNPHGFKRAIAGFINYQKRETY